MDDTYIDQTCDAQGRTPDGACFAKVDEIAQDPVDFVRDVERLIPDKDTPIYTLCRTGVRSVGAANRLTEAGYTNVRNIWEGFVGVNLKAPKQVCTDADKDPSTPEVCSIQDAAVDLNHNGALTDENKNGWRYHLGLPYETRLLPWLIYKPYAYLYRGSD